MCKEAFEHRYLSRRASPNLSEPLGLAQYTTLIVEDSFEARFSRLKRVLAAHGSPAISGRRDAAVSPVSLIADQLLAINTARIEALTEAVADRSGTRDVDEMDHVMVRLLLDECRTALTRLRAVASDADRGVRHCQLLFRDATHHLHKLRKLGDASERAANAPLDALEPPLAD
jgi:hypothetical protein